MTLAVALLAHAAATLLHHIHNAEFLADYPDIQVNGFFLDARYLRREIQEEAHRKGLIPYIPADREAEAAEE